MSLELDLVSHSWEFGMIVSWWWVLNTELTYDLFQKEHCLNVVLEGGLEQTNVETERPVMRQLQ